MRQITINAANAFIANRQFGHSNTVVTNFNNEVQMYLFTNKIAYTENGKLFINSCGWMTNTTKERLNALPNVSIRQKKGKWYLNGVEWDGKLICVDTLNEK